MDVTGNKLTEAEQFAKVIVGVRLSKGVEQLKESVNLLKNPNLRQDEIGTIQQTLRYIDGLAGAGGLDEVEEMVRSLGHNLSDGVG